MINIIINILAFIIQLILMPFWVCIVVGEWIKELWRDRPWRN